MAQQEVVFKKITTGDTAISSVSYPGDTGYSINYTSFITLGNTSDTVTLDINGVTGVTFSMLGKIDIPIDTISVRSVERNETGAPAPYIGVLVMGVKRINTIFGNSNFMG